MSGQVQIFQNVVIDAGDGNPIRHGSMSEPTVITFTGEIKNSVVDVAASTTVKILDLSVDQISAFSYLLLASDQDVMIELVTDDGNEVGERVYTIKLIGSGTAGTYGAPFQLLSNVSYANYTVNFAAGTLDYIETIRARNLSATTSAKVRLIAVQ